MTGPWEASPAESSQLPGPMPSHPQASLPLWSDDQGKLACPLVTHSSALSTVRAGTLPVLVHH